MVKTSYKDSSMFITIRNGSSMILPDELCLTSIRLWGQLDQSMQRHFDIREVFQGSENKRYTNPNKFSRNFLKLDNYLSRKYPMMHLDKISQVP